MVCDGFYKVSDQGQVRRAKPGHGTKVGRAIALIPRKARNRKNAKTYYGISAWMGNRKKDYYVHRLVAEAFLGPCPEGYEVNHKDCNPANNTLSNLEYVTSSQNKQHYYLVNRRLISGENQWNAKLKEVDVSCIRYLSKGGYPYSYISKLFDVAIGTIEKIVLRERWKDVE